ncbi:hypothetical protein AAur_0018 [Paenarthrobacter aurescens TC1]|uniref:Uncharacterized protein n=1 Tax=Paenarthrobacter aurescens (strain TC1) TaxID=290340 RepID=A1R0T7_PAEAT|nr:hypothetical protein AAur_0018 [Paenarthrobacter aurescens TC1]
MCVTYMRVVSLRNRPYARQDGRYPPKGMRFSTSVDNFVPVEREYVDKRPIFLAAVDNPVNTAVGSHISTGLSTVLITYTRVVQPVGRAVKPGKAVIWIWKPTRFPQLWITCGYGVVVKWVSPQPLSVTRTSLWAGR